MNKSICIIGVGKVGSALAFELSDSGYEINYLIDRNVESLELISSKLNPIISSSVIKKEFIEGADVVCICVQDKYINSVINEIIELDCNLDNRVFFHTSGAESSAVFPSEKFNEKFTASVHPIQTFNKVSFTNQHLLQNIYFGIEGGESAMEFAASFIMKLNSNYEVIPRDKKYLYHSACVISSNFLITLLNVSSEIIGSMGIEKSKAFEMFRPIINETLKNISKDGLINSLTGPFERNDVETISRHLNSINKELPSLIPFYTLLGMETVKVAFKKESLNLKNVVTMLDLMNEYIQNEFDQTNKTIN
ncbi:MAG: DUF2520 domain-containing protein [bacterium]